MSRLQSGIVKMLMKKAVLPMTMEIYLVLDKLFGDDAYLKTIIITRFYLDISESSSRRR